MKPVSQRVREHREKIKEEIGEDLFKKIERSRIHKIRKKQKQKR